MGARKPSVCRESFGSMRKRWRSAGKERPWSWSRWPSANGPWATGSVLIVTRRTSMWAGSFPSAGGSSISPRRTRDLAARYDRDAAEQHARIRHHLRHRPIGERDLLIAAIALAHDLTLVTHNAAEFSRVPRLRVEDWAAR